MSTVSIATNDGTGGASDSNSIIYQFRNSKGERDVSNAGVSRFKGVVDQQNGHWGSQIYANHQRIWLGTFKSEKQAAMAYDSATIKLRGGGSHRNFPWTSITVQEPDFQRQFSAEKVLKMIKDGSYPAKFADFLRTRFQSGGTDGSLCMGLGHSNGELTCRQLFRKELTPSDVGKLNRLVIPKKFALKYFPCLPESVKERVAGEKSNMELVFFDRSMKSWKFRYCYWKSSQSFVFTKGWNRFVKEKKLKAKDMVTFSVCDCKDGSNQGQALCLIDVSYSDGVKSNGGGVEDLKEDAGVKGTLKLEIRSSFDDGEKLGLDVGKNNDEWQVKKEAVAENLMLLGVGSMGGQRKGFRLFGVQII